MADVENYSGGSHSDDASADDPSVMDVATPAGKRPGRPSSSAKANSNGRRKKSGPRLNLKHLS